MLAPLLALIIVMAGFLVMFGAGATARRLLVGVMLVALFVPCVEATLCRTKLSLPQGSAVFLLVPLVVVVGVAAVRFINHRRALQHWLGEGHTSLKKRVEHL